MSSVTRGPRPSAPLAPTLDVSALAEVLETQSAANFSRARFYVQEVAISAPRALRCLVLAATCFSKVSDRRELSVDWGTVKPSVVEVFHALSSVIFLLKHDVYVSNKVIPKILADIQLLDRAVLVFQLYIHILKEIIEMLL